MTETHLPALVPADPEANITDLLLNRVRATPDLPLFSVPDRAGGWSDIRAADFLVAVRELAKGLIAAGLEPGERVGFMCSVRYEWTLVDFAAAFAGLVLVPVYETSSPAQMEHILTDSGAVALIVEGSEHVARFAAVRPAVPGVRTVWRLDDGDLFALAASGSAVPDEELEARRSAARGTDIATLIYTSGSTGRPKGCVLTHANFVELSRNTGAAMPELITPGASTLLFITTAHVFARFISLMCVHGGVRVGHQADTTQLLPSLASFRPTFLLAVPRVFEKVYNSAEHRAEVSGRGRIFRAAAATAVAHSRATDAGRIPLGLRLRFRLFDALVYGKLRAALGGNVRYAISGSAPLGERLGHFYRSLGIQVLEGYGLTETTAPATVNVVAKSKIGTVGPALPGVGVRVDDDGEISVRGINVFAGYWNDPAATAAAFDGEWFRTGDIGRLDAEGYLTITGRKKEILITAGGKNVAPAALEDPLRAHPLVAQVVVVGDRRPFVAALVTLDAEMLPAWLAQHGEDPELTPATAAQHPLVLAEVQRAVDEANTRVSRAESIRQFRILETEFTEASGHLTPKLSIKRAQIVSDFAHVIDGIYAPAEVARAR